MEQFQNISSEVEATADINPNSVINPNKVNLYKGEEAYPMCALCYFLTSVFGYKAVKRAFKMSRIKVSKRYRKDGRLGVVFIYYDHKGRIRQVKEMGYDPATGRRLKDGEPCEVYNGRSKYYELRIEGNKVIQLGRWLVENFEYKPCFFNEHLLAMFPDLPIAIVESEKTAIICSICMPDYIWLATGGMDGCPWDSPEVYEILRGRKIVVFPDLNATAEWSIKTDIVRSDGMDIQVYPLDNMDFVTDEDREAGLDIGDFMIRVWQQEHPEAGEKPEVTQAPAAVVPELTNVLSKLSPSRPKAQSIEETYEIDMSHIIPPQPKNCSSKETTSSTPDQAVSQPIWANQTLGASSGQSVDVFDFEKMISELD